MFLISFQRIKIPIDVILKFCFLYYALLRVYTIFFQFYAYSRLHRIIFSAVLLAPPNFLSGVEDTIPNRIAPF